MGSCLALKMSFGGFEGIVSGPFWERLSLAEKITTTLMCPLNIKIHPGADYSNLYTVETGNGETASPSHCHQTSPETCLKNDKTIPLNNAWPRYSSVYKDGHDSQSGKVQKVEVCRG